MCGPQILSYIFYYHVPTTSEYVPCRSGILEDEGKGEREGGACTSLIVLANLE